ncbi:hypothetical protein M433DRAFT_511934 [Acidomyces richmondensis BFW]|nr:hypothetical protein M433DRAFT_511934 [Acidomyces richmondensis BFW]
MLAADPKKHPSAMSIVADMCEEARTEHLTQGVPNPDSFQRLNGRMRSEDPPFIQDHSNASFWFCLPPTQNSAIYSPKRTSQSQTTESKFQIHEKELTAPWLFSPPSDCGQAMNLIPIWSDGYVDRPIQFYLIRPDMEDSVKRDVSSYSRASSILSESIFFNLQDRETLEIIQNVLSSFEGMSKASLLHIIDGDDYYGRSEISQLGLCEGFQVRE